MLLPLRLQAAPPANKLRFRHDVSLTVSVAVGTPPQNVTMVLDTGSELSWLLCNGTGAPRPAAAFDVPASSTYATWRGRDLPVRPFCAAPPSDSCRVSLSYADASSADTFLLGGAPPVPALFGCVTSYYSATGGGGGGGSNGTNSSEAATGLLGMNRGSLSFVTQTATHRFAYCIAPGDGPGLLVLGGDGLALAPPLNYTPLIEIPQPLPYFDRVAYSVQLEGIRVGATLLPIPKSVLTPDHTGAGQTMVDSGTQFTFLLAEAYAALKAEFANRTRALLAPLGEPGFVFQGAFDACFRAPEARVAAACPQLPEQNVWVEYDLRNGRVGFAPARCDLATERLGSGA
ncbi:aspartic proteinase PCS1-like [Panicum miliaceum]|uniref:Aspartic proteinase PCS1-like n=1 Tax=Panicum miliaceum TaxID=4540 RepID=A0A3L6TGR3_PANMI|nr:aspartic proteinase PCS1-like [Panicum miliaceum]